MNPFMRLLRDSRLLRCILYFLFAGLLSIALGHQAHALDISWRNENGGAFSNTGNWFGGLVPTNTDVAHFGVNAGPSRIPSYTVTFSANVTNQSLVIHDDPVVFDLNTRTYATTTTAGIAVGADAGRFGDLTVTDGTINALFLVSVGAVANGTGTLIVTTGGQIIGSPNLNVGDLHTGTLVVQSGGVISAGNNSSTIIGNNGGVTGTATITDPGSALTTNALAIGNSGTGTLNLSILGHLQVNSGAVIGNNSGSTGTANVNISAQWINTENLTVGASGHGELNISTIGLVRNTNGIVGKNSVGSGTVTVDGANSLWDNTGTLVVGDGGTGQVFITNQGHVRNTTGTLGGLNGGGTLTVRDVGSQWLNSGQLLVGGLGGGTLNINAGGYVENTTGVIGNGLNSRGNDGTVNVDGSGSGWSNSSSLTVGNGGKGTLHITHGGLVSSTGGIIGDDAGGNGFASVVDSGSLWNSSSSLFIGNSGEGTLSITAGGHVTSGSGALDIDRIGSQASGSGHVLVDGPESLWVNRGGLLVGAQGIAELEIKNGATVDTGVGTIGSSQGSQGNVTVDGEDSKWHLASILTIGGTGDGFLNVTDRGVVNNTFATIGDLPGSTGTVTVTDTGSLWDNSGELIVGHDGEGVLTIEAGGRVENSNGWIGKHGDGVGTVTVTDTGSLWDNSGALTVGDEGVGFISVLDGGRLESHDGTIGKTIGSSGRVEVKGGTSAWINTADLDVGFGGLGELRVIDGGYVENINGGVGKAIGVGLLGNGFVFVDGPNSRWINLGDLSLGLLGAATIEITGGGLVQNNDADLGVAGGYANVTVSDPGSKWNILGNLTLGRIGFGSSVTINAGGTVSVAGTMIIPDDKSTISLNGGELNLLAIVIGSDANFIFNGGTLRFTHDYLLDDFLLDNVLNAGHSIGALQHLAVDGKPTLETVLRIDGGTFSAGSLVRGSPLFFNSGTFNLTSDNFTIGPAGLFGDTLALSNRNVNITNAATIQNGARLQLQGGAFSAGTLTNQGTIDFQNQSSQISGGLLTNTGTIRGSGSILNNIQNNTVGQIQTTAGQRLEFGGAVTNAGTISLVGGQMQFNAAVANSASTGLISVRDATVRFVGGLANNGSLSVSLGNSDVFGDITNSATGRIIVSGGAAATFYDDVANGGSISVSAAGSLKSTAVFLGSLSGNGVSGAGQVFIEGDARPGFSPASMNFGGDVTFGPAASIEIEIGGTSAGIQHDRLNIAGMSAIDGQLSLALINGFLPNAADNFTILSAGSLLGLFSNVANGQRLDTIDGAGSFLVHYGAGSTFNPNQVVLSSFELAALAGDYNNNGKVDAADYVLWRKSPGTYGGNPVGYNTWRANFGQPPGSASAILGSASTAVPEPTTLVLLMFAATGWCLWRVRAA